MSTIKALEFPNESFETKGELFAHLKKYKETLIGLKKAKAINSDSIKATDIRELEAIKAANVEDGFIHAVINTTKYLDSHNDLHLDGIWTKSVGEQQGKIYFVSDHDLTIKSVIAFPKDVEMKVEQIAWKDLGADFEGSTEALIFKVAKEDIQLKEAKTIIEQKVAIEHSVRMQYVNIDLAINSEEKDLAEERALWDSTIGLVANKAQALEQGYFWAVGEAKIFKEGSMVLSGSNDVTPMLLSKQEIEPSKDTHTIEPSEDTQKDNAPDEKDSDGDFINHYFV
jgi:hypothetical protein